MKKIYKKVIVLVIAGYTLFTLYNQQITLNQYSRQSEELNEKIAEETKNNEDLKKQKDNVNSLEFREQTAREKLDMYYPNERVYIDEGM